MEEYFVDPGSNQNWLIIDAVDFGWLQLIKRFLRDPRVDPTVRNNFPIFLASINNRCKIVDLLLTDLRIDSMSETMPNFKKIQMIRSRAADVCFAMQDLFLPALVTLEILDALIPNSIPMCKKWDLITAIKHFHTR